MNEQYNLPQSPPASLPHSNVTTREDFGGFSQFLEPFTQSPPSPITQSPPSPITQSPPSPTFSHHAPDEDELGDMALELSFGLVEDTDFAPSERGLVTVESLLNGHLSPNYEETPTAPLTEDDLSALADKYISSADTYLPTTSVPTLDPMLWESFAYELAIGAMPLEAILVAYELTEEAYQSLMSNETFFGLLTTKRVEVAELGKAGADVSFVVKMRMVANRAAGVYLQRLLNPMTNDRDFHMLFKTATELAKFNQPKQEVANAGANIVFNIKGVPDLDHLQAVRNAEDGTFTELEKGGDNGSRD